METNDTKRYRVNEIFYSLQGEGFHTGRPAVFLRLSGCNRMCPFCDTDHSRHTLMSAGEIIEKLSRYPSKFLVITGGEPMLQLDDALTGALKSAGYYIAVETNGSLPVPKGVDWVTCSPKEKPWQIDRIDELKIVYLGEDPRPIAAELPAARHHFLQPCSGKNISETVRFIMEHPEWRLSLQTHKIIGIQ